MSSLRAPTLRHLLRQPLCPTARFNQRRWAQVQDVRFLATHGTQERVLAKYKEKLETKAKEEGKKDISELKEAYKEKIERLRKQAAVPGATAPLDPPPSASASPSTSELRQTPPPPPSPSPSSNTSTPPSSPSSTPSSSPVPPPGVKTLSSFLDIPKILSLPEAEITTLWRLRHASNPQSLHFALPISTFSTLLQTARKHPQFILPLPRPDPEASPETVEAGTAPTAAEIHFLQWTHPAPDTTTLLFTHLAEFKLRGEFASPHTTVTFHQELSEAKGLVLGQGTVVEGRGVTVDEAKWLVMCLQKFYGVQGGEGERRRLLEMFTEGDEGFRVERLLEEAEKVV